MADLAMRIYVVDHSAEMKEFSAPYCLLHVGNKQISGPGSYEVDSSGDNIAFKNFAYSELTGLYWIWKNGLFPITGLMHYRRFLSSESGEGVVSEDEILGYMDEYDCIVPEKMHAMCNLGDHYCYYHLTEDLAILEDVLADQPEDIRSAYQEIMGQPFLIPYNIVIAKESFFEAYCPWLFSILEKCEERVDLFRGRDAYQQRVFGFLSERLFNVWLRAKRLRCKYLPLLNTEASEGAAHGSATSAPLFLQRSRAVHGLRPEQVFVPEDYLELHPDLQEEYHGKPDELFEEYLDEGLAQNRLGSFAYSLEDYKNLHPEVRGEYINDAKRYFSDLREELEHSSPIISSNKILGITKISHIDFSPVYDWAYYSARYDDAPKDFFHSEADLQHFLEVGIQEGRTGSKGFSLERFKEKHPMLARLFGNRNALYYYYYILIDSKNVKGVDWRYVER